MRTARTISLAVCLALSAGLAQAKDFRIGLQEDPDVLDPDQSRTFVGRIVYASLCDKLVDITPDLKIIPSRRDGLGVEPRRQGADHDTARRRGVP